MSKINMDARQEALAILESFNPTPTSLINYQSNGRVIVIGDESALKLCAEFTEPLKPTLISMNASAKKVGAGIIALNRRTIDIQGYMGKFVISLIDADNLAETLQADIILDLNAEPLITLEIPPPGYVHALPASQNAKALENQLLELTGEFEKPKYFKYNPTVCAHGVNGKTVCTNCIDACPAGAIGSLIEKIEVDPYLCQGGGTCASVCPSGAIQYVYPGLADSGNQVRKMLETFRQHGGSAPIVMFHAVQDFPEALLKSNISILPFRVEELASVGPDLCISTLVYGASQVILLADDEIPAISLTQLLTQLEWLQSLLSGLGLDSQLIRLQQESGDYLALQFESTIEPAIYTMPDNKRNAIYQALDHLYQYLEKTRELVSLPAGAPFGTAVIDENRCTLCMACVGACPGKALQDGSNREMPEVFFIESLCIQCGACTRTCPEDAISISPRMVFDREKRNQSRALNQDVPFGCISCGKLFASTTVIQKMNEKLKDHHMFKTPRALDRLKMCEDCRVADIVQDPEAMNGNFGSLN